MESLVQTYGPHSPGLLYQYRNEPGPFEIVTGQVAAVARRIADDLDKRGEDKVAVIMGVDERLSHRLVGELSNTVWEGCASTEVGRSSCTGGLSAPREVVYSLSSMAPWAWAKALGRCAIA